MFYVNPKFMELEPQVIDVEAIISILIIPKEQRSFKDHETIYKFFHINNFLQEIQRTKSLNAKIKCASLLQIKDQKPQREFQLVSKFKLERQENNKIYYEHYYVVVSLKSLQEIKSSDERYLRTNMNHLRQFSILENMKYQQLLHLAYYMTQYTFKYKEYLFKQGDQSTYLYLVLEGEFHYIKSVDQNQQQSNIERRKTKKQQKFNDNPNKIKKRKLKEFRIGVIQGGIGQVMGQEELITKQKRQCSLICMSTQNKVIQIHRDYYLNVMKGNQGIKNYLLKESEKKKDFKKKTLQNMIAAKANYKKYVKFVESSQKLKSKEFKEALERLKSEAQQEDSSIYVSNKSQEANRKLIQNLSKSRITTKNNKSLESEEKNDSHFEQENFSLTYIKGIKKEKKISQSVHGIKEKSTFLPKIKPEKNQLDSLKIGKSWSIAKPTVELKKMRGRFQHLIDSNISIQEKESPLSKKLTKDLKNDIIPIQLPKKKDPALYQFQKTKPNKEELREMRSAVRSKNYMQKLLVDALKKAGYSKKYQIESQNSKKSQLKKKFKTIQQKLEKKLKTDPILQKNKFDEFYFQKM